MCGRFVVPSNAVDDAISVYRKMFGAEAQVALKTRSLQLPIPHANSRKYLSEFLDKVVAFQNNGVAAGTDETVLEFVLNKQGCQDLISTAVDQAGSKSVDADKINFEGISDPALRNVGVAAY